jgi:hypothetical protein
MGNELILDIIFQLLVAIGIFVVLVYVGKYIIPKSRLLARFKASRFSNPLEYFPSEGIMSLKQLFYLVMILVFIITILYLTFDWKGGSYLIFVLDILVSVCLAINWSTDTLKNKFILFLLIPFGSITGILFGDSIVFLLDLTHIIGYLYFIKVYFRKFVEYTENNGLGITIILLFGIILISFLFTILVENVSPMDSITMVSNAFTSNSFDASGKNIIGKLNSLVLAWSGFILSGVGTATLAVSIVNNYVDRQFSEMKEFVKKKKEEE